MKARGRAAPNAMAFDADNDDEVNPFQPVPNPQSAAEHRQNANHATYERMRADAKLAKHNATMGATKQHAMVAAGGADLFANAHTAKWVEREMLRKAKQAKAQEQAKGLQTRGSRLERGNGISREI